MFGNARQDSRAGGRAFVGKKIEKMVAYSRRGWGQFSEGRCLSDRDLARASDSPDCIGREFGRLLYQMLDMAVDMRSPAMEDIVG